MRQYAVVVVFIVAIVISFFAFNLFMGIGYWGPTKTTTATVASKHIGYSADNNGRQVSQYMVTTDKWTFEVEMAGSMYGMLTRFMVICAKIMFTKLLLREISSFGGHGNIIPIS